jgi:hypothetical protein
MNKVWNVNDDGCTDNWWANDEKSSHDLCPGELSIKIILIFLQKFKIFKYAHIKQIRYLYGSMSIILQIAF